MKACVVIIYMNLGPYHIARLRALAELLPQVHAIEVAAEQKLYPWRPSRDQLGFALTTLFAHEACEAIPVRTQCNAVKSALSELSPAVVLVAGYREPCMRAAADWARKCGVPAILQFVSTCRDRPRVWWKEALKSRVFKWYAGIAATGQRAEQYALRLGAQPGTVVRVGNVVDNTYYTIRSEMIRQHAPQERRTLTVPARYFLTVSRMSTEKNLRRLLEAFARYRKDGGLWDLVLVGSGPQEAELRETVGCYSIPGVHFVGWSSYEKLPSYYALASCLVLPSMSETWGLVVNEAMASGLPVLVSDNCGCVPELCKPQQNGFSFDPQSTDELAQLMGEVASNDARLATYGEASRRIISSFTPQTWAEGLRECIAVAERRKV